MYTFYNEFDPAAAEWIRQLIKRGLIAPGEVDERSILEVQPADLRGFTQCHFFAGIGVWSHALRTAGWPDDRPVWTGSCPCQPFSDAGKGDEFGDERHLWPVWFRLIRECKPESVFGEQVASKDAFTWLDHVSTDLEGEGYTFGAVDTCAAGFGAPHIRQRLYFAAESNSSNRRPDERAKLAWAERGKSDGDSGATGELAHGKQQGLEGHAGNERNGDEPGWQREDEARPTSEGGPTNGFWADAIWLPCRDGKSRPTEPGAFPLVDGSATGVVRGGDPGAPDPQNTAEARVMRLKGYGNAICSPQATDFVRAYLDECANPLPVDN